MTDRRSSFFGLTVDSPLNPYLIGAGSILDLSGSYFDFSTDTSDTDALRSDWQMVGSDIASAVEKFSVSSV